MKSICNVLYRIVCLSVIFYAFQLKAASPEELINHCLWKWTQKVAETPASDSKDDKNRKSQSAAFLEVEPFEKIAATLPFIQDYSTWLHGIVQEEEAYKDDYYVVYHACSHLSLFHDVLKLAIAAKLNLSLPDDFVFMRIPWKEMYQIDDVEDYFTSFGVPGHPPDPPVEMQRRWIEICLQLLGKDLSSLPVLESDTLQLYRRLELMWFLPEPHLQAIFEDSYADFIRQLIGFEGSSEEFKQYFRMKVGSFKGPLSTNISEAEKNLRQDLHALFIESVKITDDYSAKLQDHLLCVNLTLFGNYDSGGDCSLVYWYDKCNHIPKNVDLLLLEILDLFSLNEDALQELKEIYSLIHQEDNIIFAIFIPKCLTNKVMYLSRGFYDPISLNFTPFQVLNIYQTNIRALAPSNIPFDHNYKTLESRLVFTQKYLLNPYSGVKYIKHHVIDSKKYLQYQLLLKEWAEKNFN